MSSHSVLPTELVTEGRRLASICNACRYCEGYCAVFPAIERRLDFSSGDIAYLANLCHNCGACYYACQYAPPHEFAVNIPRLLADVRTESYQCYAWPNPLAQLFERNGTVVSVVLAGCLAFLWVVLAVVVDRSAFFGAHSDGEGSFYTIISHRAMAYAFGGAFLYAVVALAIGAVRFWRHTGERVASLADPSSLGQSLGDVLRLKYLGGGGDGCTYPDEQPSHLRRWFHQLTFYGFLLCFLATGVATLYHYGLGRPAPYPFWSAPVLLGTVGGVGLLVGPAGLLWLKQLRDPALAPSVDGGMDLAFLWLLMLTAGSGLLLLALRESTAMGLVLTAHLAIVMALFLTMPYGKFVHAVYRAAALMRYHIERQRPLPEVGSE